MTPSANWKIVAVWNLVLAIVTGSLAIHLHVAPELVLRAKGGGFQSFTGPALDHLRNAAALFSLGLLISVTYLARYQSTRFSLKWGLMTILGVLLAWQQLQAARRASVVVGAPPPRAVTTVARP